MLSYLNSKILQKIIDNMNFSNNKGMIIASPSVSPPYQYHWVRDASLVMRVIIDYYNTTKEDKYFKFIINYLENCHIIQNLDTISGLGEPKININKTPFNKEWGRPQNDGPAIRGLNMIKLIDIFRGEYDNIIKMFILPILEKDINYILNNYNKICFDLWEEIKGWHFYTRILQLKFIKEFINLDDNIKSKLNYQGNIKNIYNDLLINCKHHIGGKQIISSFDKNGNINKYNDSSILLAFCHINFDEDIMKIFPDKYILNNINDLITYFRSKYNINDLNMIGRYKNDKYYDGHIWIICTLGMVQVYLYFYNKNKNNFYYNISENIIYHLLSINTQFDLSEQYNPKTNKMLSAEKLTWNYSEFYFTNKKMIFKN